MDNGCDRIPPTFSLPRVLGSELFGFNDPTADQTSQDIELFIRVDLLMSPGLGMCV